MTENPGTVSPAYIAATFGVSRATSYRMLSRMRAVRIGRGKYIVPSLDVLWAMSHSPGRGETPGLQGVSGKSVPTHAAPHNAPGRGVGGFPLDRSPSIETYKKEKGKGEEDVNNQQVTDMDGAGGV